MMSIKKSIHKKLKSIKDFKVAKEITLENIFSIKVQYKLQNMPKDLIHLQLLLLLDIKNQLTTH